MVTVTGSGGNPKNNPLTSSAKASVSQTPLPKAFDRKPWPQAPSAHARLLGRWAPAYTAWKVSFSNSFGAKSCNIQQKTEKPVFTCRVYNATLKTKDFLGRLRYVVMRFFGHDCYMAYFYHTMGLWWGGAIAWAWDEGKMKLSLSLRSFPWTP